MLKRGDDLLALKRIAGRSEEEGKYELPSGKIGFGEQPEEAMGRVIYDVLGEKLDALGLVDVVTFTELSEASQIGNLYVVYEGALGDVVRITADRYSAYRWIKKTETHEIELDEASRTILMIEQRGQRWKMASDGGRARSGNLTGAMAKVYVDGGSRGNPGPSGVGYYIIGAEGEELKRGVEFVGFATGRVAEYYAIKEGVEQAIELGLKSVRFMSDNLMAVNQLNGIYKVKNKDLIPIYDKVLKLLERIDNYSFEHVPREQNREADAEVNKVIDWHMD